MILSSDRNNKIVFKRRDMARHDLVSVQTSNVCITSLAAFNAIACMYQTICDVCPKGEKGEVGW